MNEGLLHVLLFLPLVAGCILLGIPSRHTIVFRWITLGTSLIQVFLAAVLWVSYAGSSVAATTLDTAYAFVTKIIWIRWDLGTGGLFVDYHVGVDGVSLPLVLLSAIVLTIAAVSSWTIQYRVKGFYLLFLLLNTSVIGCFVALDFFLFYLFFEFMLLPMFFLIGIWGGQRRQYASVKFFLYTLAGSLFILISMIVLYQSVEVEGQSTFNFLALMNPDYYVGSGMTSWFGLNQRQWAFWLLVAGFLIKLPAVPIHTWLPDAHVEAPTSVSVLLAGLLLKVGGYGLVRTAIFMFPDVAIEFAPALAVLAIISILYGSLLAMAQNNLKRLVAYSSVAHMGFVLLGLSSLTLIGLTGAVFQMVSHGILSPALFLLVGVLYERTNDRKIENFSGLAGHLPQFTFFTGLFFFASLGLPTLSGFVGELMNLMGAFQAAGLVGGWVGPVAVLGILMGAIYFLWTLQRMFFGNYWVRKKEWEDRMTDLTTREWLMLLPLAILTLLLGVFPSLLTQPLEESLAFWHSHIQTFLGR